jgi:hypothetical protein
VRITPVLLLALVTPLSSAAAQHAAPQAEDMVETGAASSRGGVQTVDPWRAGNRLAGRGWDGLDPAPRRHRRGGNEIVIGAVIGTGVGGWIGGVLITRRR